MITLEIEGVPTPWAAHKGYGNRSFNPRLKQKQYCQWQIQAQYNQKKPLSGPVILSVAFHLPIPKGTSKVRVRQMLNGIMHHIKKPDVDNLNKFICDCLKTIVFEDDSQIFEIHSKKLYSETPKTVIHVRSANILDSLVDNF